MFLRRSLVGLVLACLVLVGVASREHSPDGDSSGHVVPGHAQPR